MIKAMREGGRLAVVIGACALACWCAGRGRKCG